MKGTKIQWSDDTVNPTSGCDGCELWTADVRRCYAGNFHETRLAAAQPALYDRDFSNVRILAGRMVKALRCMDLNGKDRPDKPWLNGLRRKIFVGDLGDIFSAGVPFDYLRTEILDLALTAHGNRHDLQLLTKQPHRAAEFAAWLAEQGVAWPDNVWIGTSITGRASKSRIKHLRRVPAAVRYLSVEPLVEDPMLSLSDLDGIRWVIIGGESDQGSDAGREFKLEWLDDVIDLCRAANTALFVKQLGSTPTVAGNRLLLRDGHGGEWDEWEPRLRIREMPYGSS